MALIVEEPQLLQGTEEDKALKSFLIGVAGIFLGVLFAAVAPGPEAAVASGLMFMGFITLPFMAYGIYKSFHLLTALL